MPSDIGLTFEERIRRTLAPLGGPLRIDSFIALMGRERARLTAEQARRSLAQAAARPAPAPAAPEEAKGLGMEGEPAPRRAAAPPAAALEKLSDSGKIRAEVDAFLRRDEVQDVSSDEVADYMDFLGTSGLQPGDLPEE